MSLACLKRGLVLFWAAWFTIVFATNLCDALKEFGWLAESWQFASGNYRFMASTTARYALGSGVNAFLFAGVIGWEAAAAVLFWLAGVESWKTGVRAARFLYPAFLVSLMLWAAFAIADEILIAYAVQATHLRLFIAQLASLLAIILLPDAPSARDSGPPVDSAPLPG